MSFDSEYKPPLQPPDWVFGPVWTFLYATLAISIFWTWRDRAEIENSNLLIGAFALQMLLNLTWTYAFNSERYVLSTLMLFGMVALTSYYAYGLYSFNQLASVIVWPYIAWVTFASILNIFYLVEA
tara:strand:+ start:804 stop:1181 length:378 start_codon:yes stop_codon:yes gene_type:complete